MKLGSPALGIASVALTVALALAPLALAQQPRQPAVAPQTPRTTAPYDITGYWVSVVMEDWRWRMITPPPGDYASVPLNAAGREAADSWDREADIANGNECRPYGAGGIMRVPGRVRIGWEDDDKLKLETDAGQQTRLFHFVAFTPSASPTWQGDSVASWEMVGATRGRPATGGSLKVVTTGMKTGLATGSRTPLRRPAMEITTGYQIVSSAMSVPCRR